MRDAAVSALLRLYSVQANLSSMQVFTERFQQRFAELVRRLQHTHCSCAIHLSLVCAAVR